MQFLKTRLTNFEVVVVNFVTPRKVAKSVYNAYTDTDYNAFSTNLNPLNPTELETQYSGMVNEIRRRVKEAYIQNKIPTEDMDVFDVENPSIEGVSDALDNIINKMKLEDNPLYEVMKEGLDPKPLLTAGDPWPTYPFVLDCNGIEAADFAGTGSTNRNPNTASGIDDEESGSGDSSNIGASSSDESANTASADYITYTITYNNTDRLMQDDWGPKEYNKSTGTLEFKNGIPLDEKYAFTGWYLDNLFSEKVPGNKLSNPRKNLQLYANVVKNEDYDSGNVSKQVVAGNKPIVGVEDNKCEIRELEWLKIILMVLKICKILINTLVMIYNVARAASEIAKDAQLCWINPPSLMSLINYVMQRCSSIIFMVLGKLLLYLWSLLNLDCLSNRSMSLINEINAILAGVSSTISSVESAAVELSGGSLQKAWADAMNDLKKKVKDAKTEFKTQWENIGSQLVGSLDETGLSQLKNAFVTDPWGFLADNIVPDEIKNRVMDLYDTMQTGKDVVNVLMGQIKSKNKSKQEKQGEDKKGLEKEIL